MSIQFKLEAKKRDCSGSSAAKSLRRSGEVPGVLYGHGLASIKMTLSHAKLLKCFSHETFQNQMITLDLEGKKYTVVLKSFELHPYKPVIQHIDFMRVKSDEPITMEIPLHFIGESEAPGLKSGGVFIHNVTTLTVKCLPSDLPQHIEVDLSNMALNQMLHLSDMSLPKNVQVVHATEDMPIVSMHIPRAEKVETQEETSETEAETNQESDTENQENKKEDQ